MYIAGIFVLYLLIPAWFLISLVAVIRKQIAVKSTTEPAERVMVIRSRNMSLVSLVLSSIVIGFFIYLYVLSGIEC